MYQVQRMHALPIMAATILSAGKTTTLYNVPNIHDTQTTTEDITTTRRKSVTKKSNKIIIDTKDIK